MTHSQFKLGKGRHVDDADGLFTAFHFCSNNVKPVWFVEGLTLIQSQQIYKHIQNQSLNAEEIKVPRIYTENLYGIFMWCNWIIKNQINSGLCESKLNEETSAKAQSYSLAGDHNQQVYRVPNKQHLTPLIWKQSAWEQGTDHNSNLKVIW